MHDYMHARLHVLTCIVSVLYMYLKYSTVVCSVRIRIQARTYTLASYGFSVWSVDRELQSRESVTVREVSSHVDVLSSIDMTISIIVSLCQLRVAACRDALHRQ